MRRISPFFTAALLGLLLTGCDTSEEALGSLSLYWSPPLERVDGTDLPASEIEGYEIRYWHESETGYETVFIHQGSDEAYHFDSLPKSLDGYTFQVATVDTNGLYSEFVTAQP